MLGMRLPLPGAALADASRTRRALGCARFYEMVLGGLAVQQRPARSDRRAPAGGLAQSRGADARRPCARKRCARSSVRRRHARRCSSSIGIQAVPTPAWLKRIVIGALLALVLLAGRPRLRALVHADARARPPRPRSRVRRIVRDTIDMLGEPVGRRRAAVWIGAQLRHLDARHGRRVPRRPLGRDRPRRRSTPCSSRRRSRSASRFRPRPGTSARISGSASRRSACSTCP